LLHLRRLVDGTADEQDLLLPGHGEHSSRQADSTTGWAGGLGVSPNVTGVAAEAGISPRTRKRRKRTAMQKISLTRLIKTRANPSVAASGMPKAAKKATYPASCTPRPAGTMKASERSSATTTSKASTAAKEISTPSSRRMTSASAASTSH